MPEIPLPSPQVDVKRIDENRGTNEGKMGLENRKIFVGGLPDTCDSLMLKYFLLLMECFPK